MSSIHRFTIFKNVQRSPKGFRYKSRFYDAKEEERQARRKAVELQVAREKGLGVDASIPAGSIRFDRKVSRTAKQQKSLFWSNIRLVVILIVLIGLAVYTWFYFKSTFL